MKRLLPVFALVVVVMAALVARLRCSGDATTHASAETKSTTSPRAADEDRSTARSAYLAQREKIRNAVARKVDMPPKFGEAPARRSSAPGAGAPGATLDAEYMGKAIRDILPLMKQCFENARDARPDLGPVTLTVKFTVIADPTFGGVVDTSEIVPNDDGGSAPDNPDLTECVTQSVFALRFPPPADDGRDEVVIPFSYRPSGPKQQ